jgi:hypothetical protein
MNEAQAMKHSVLLNPQAMTAGATQTANLDCLGADYSTIHATVALGATATIASSDGTTVKLLSSDDTNATNFATIKSFTGIKASQNVVFHTDTRVGKRYLRISVTTGTSGVTNEAATVSSIGTLSRLEAIPSSAAGMVGASDQCYLS